MSLTLEGQNEPGLIGKKDENSNFEIIAYPGAMIGEWYVKGNKVFVKIKKEPVTVIDGITHDYNYHFAFGIKNKATIDEEIMVYIECESEHDPDLVYQPLLFEGGSLESDFDAFKGESRTDTFRKYWFRRNIPAKKTVHIANFYFRTYDRVKKRLETLAHNRNVRTHVYGYSIDGRDLLAYEYPGIKEGGRQMTVLVTSGFHFPEQDALASEAIMEFLNIPENREKYPDVRFVVIPLVNPDGYAHGYNGCNRAGINLYWNFAEHDAISCPEAAALWRYIQGIKPTVYLDFHSYTFQLHRKSAGPYLKPHLFYPGKHLRSVVRKIDQKLLELFCGHAFRGYATYVPSTLPTILTREYNTITYSKIHLALKDGIEHARGLSVKSLVAVLDGIKDMNCAHSNGGRFEIISKKAIMVWVCFFSLLVRIRKKLTVRRKD